MGSNRGAPTVQTNVTWKANVGRAGSPSYRSLWSTPILTGQDMENGFLGHAYQHTETRTVGSSSAQVNLLFDYETVAPQLKAQTLLWVPSDNSTLSNLPLGLQRYTGEQDFDLLVVNNTLNYGVQRPTISQNNVPSPSGGAYGVQLFPGLNNILVPRGAFLSSPLGQALLNDSSVSPAALPGPLTFNPTQWETWVNSSETNPTSANYVQVVSSTDMSCGSGPASACQGLASNPALEPASDQSRQVQSIITFNVSSQAQLNDLLGGLLLNASGNLTGSMLNATAELPTLGLSSNVLTALANPAYTNVGAWGAPTSSYTPPPPPPSWWAEVAAGVMNSVSGVLHTVEGLVSVLWNAAVAAEAYLAKVAQAEANALGITALANQLGNTLKAVAAAMLQALQALVQYLVAQIQVFLRPAISAISNAISGALAGLIQSFETMLGVVEDGSYIQPSQAAPFWESLGAALLGLELFSAVILVVLSVVEGVGLGAGFVTDIMLGLLITIVTTAVTFLSGSILSAFAAGGARLVYGFEAFLNLTPLTRSAPITSQRQTPAGSGVLCGYQPEFDSWAQAFFDLNDVLALIPATIGAAVVIAAAGRLPGPAAIPIMIGANFALALLSVLFDVAALAVGSKDPVAALGLAIGAFINGLASIIVSFKVRDVLSASFFKAERAFATINKVTQFIAIGSTAYSGLTALQHKASNNC